MAITYTTLILIFVTCGLCIIMIKSAENADNRDHLQTPRPDKSRTRRLLNTVDRHKVDRDHRDEGTSEITLLKGKKSRAYGETSLTNQDPFERTTENFDSHHIIGDRHKKILITWTNEQYLTLLRLAFLGRSGRFDSRSKRFDWRMVKDEWVKKYGNISETVLSSQVSYLLKKMRSSVKEFEGGITWTKQLNKDLLQIYFATENGIKSKHGDRILAEWKRKSLPGYNILNSNNLLERAKELLDSVKKFSLDNPQGQVRKGSNVDWQTKHNIYLRYLWQKYPMNTTDRVQKIYDEAKEEFPGIGLLEQNRVYEYAKLVSSRPMKGHETSASHEGSVQDRTQIQYHSFLDEHNFPSTSAGAHSYHGEMASSSSYPGPSYGQPDLDLRLNTLNSSDQNSDTELRLGW